VLGAVLPASLCHSTPAPGVSDILDVLRPQGLLLALDANRPPGRRPTPKQEEFLAPVAITAASGVQLPELEHLFTTWSEPLRRCTQETSERAPPN